MTTTKVLDTSPEIVANCDKGIAEAIAVFAELLENTFELYSDPANVLRDFGSNNESKEKAKEAILRIVTGINRTTPTQYLKSSVLARKLIERYYAKAVTVPPRQRVESDARKVLIALVKLISNYAQLKLFAVVKDFERTEAAQSLLEKAMIELKMQVKIDGSEWKELERLSIQHIRENGKIIRYLKKSTA